MGIYIENMKLPEECGRCAFCEAPAKQWKCIAAHKPIDADNFFMRRPDWCPAEEVDLDDYKNCFNCGRLNHGCHVFMDGQQPERGINDDACEEWSLEATA